MKILQVIPSYWPATQFGGTVFASHGLNKVLAKKGIDLTVYTTNVGLEGKVAVNRETMVDGVKVRYFGFNQLFEFLGPTGWQFSRTLANALKENIRSSDIVHIIALWNYPTTIAAHYCRKYQKPYIISPHGALYPYTMGKKFWKKWLYYHLFIKDNLRSATAVHYTSQDEARQCNSFLGLKNKSVIIPNGIDTDEFLNLPSKEDLINSYPVLRDKKIILFLGRINWKKGLDILIKAFAGIAGGNANAHLLIVGNDEGGYKKKVETWIRECGIGERVTFAGELSGINKLRAYSGSDVFVLPSYSENFGMTVVEAMACGLPVIVSNKVAISGEIKNNNAGIIVDTNAESLYNGIKDLLGNDILRRDILKNGKRLVQERYNIENAADMMITAYSDLSMRR